MEGKIIQGIEILDVMRLVVKRKKMHQRMFLDSLEQIIDRDSEEYPQIRKLFLDHSNDLARAIIKELLGDDFEGVID